MGENRNFKYALVNSNQFNSSILNEAVKNRQQLFAYLSIINYNNYSIRN